VRIIFSARALFYQIPPCAFLNSLSCLEFEINVRCLCDFILDVGVFIQYVRAVRAHSSRFRIL